MCLKDLKGISRELIVLNNTENFKTSFWQQRDNNSHFTLFEFETKDFNQVKMVVNYYKKKCYNSIFLLHRA